MKADRYVSTKQGIIESGRKSELTERNFRRLIKKNIKSKKDEQKMNTENTTKMEIKL